MAVLRRECVEGMQPTKVTRGSCILFSVCFFRVSPSDAEQHGVAYSVLLLCRS